MTEVEAEMILRQILKQKKFAKLRPFGEPDFYLNQMLKTISDAATIKARLKNVFEEHEKPSIIIVGGGPTGVEVAAEAREFADAVQKTLKGNGARKAHISLVDAGGRLLPAMLFILRFHHRYAPGIKILGIQFPHSV